MNYDDTDDDGNSLLSPTRLRFLQQPYCHETVLAPKSFNSNRLLRPKRNVEELRIDLNGVASQRYLATMIRELHKDLLPENHEKNEERHDLETIFSRSDGKAEGDNPLLLLTSCSSSSDCSDSDSQSESSTKRKRIAIDSYGNLTAHFRLKKPIRRSDDP